MDGSASVAGYGAGILIIDLQGQETHVVVKFKFQTSNNGVYEALIRGAEMAEELGIVLFSESLYLPNR